MAKNQNQNPLWRNGQLPSSQSEGNDKQNPNGQTEQARRENDRSASSKRSK